MVHQSSLFRSEVMSLIQIYIPFELAHTTVSRIGEQGQIEFIDLNPETNAFQRAFVSELRRLDELDRKLRFFASKIEKTDAPVAPLPEFGLHTKIRSAQDIEELESTINTHESRLTDLIASYEDLQRTSSVLHERRHVLIESARFFRDVVSRQDNIRNSFDESEAPLLDNSDAENAMGGNNSRSGGINLNFVSGVIPRSRMGIFERILWRSLRGNLYLNYAEIEEPVIDPSTDEPINKNVFIIFAHGNETTSKIRKISESLGATLYSISDHQEARQQQLQETEAKIEDLDRVLFNTSHAKKLELSNIADDLAVWQTVVKKEKAIYHTLNFFNYDNNRRCLIAEGWCATNDIDQVQATLKASGDSESSLSPILHEVSTSKQPPTYHRTNKFTVGFQEIVDSYGMADYGEVNPGLFTIISFPFLFAVMFGDLGHALVMTAVALYIVLNEKQLSKIKSEEFSMFFGGRYIILLMGLFSIFTGLIYNDIFSISMTLFKSGWEYPPHEAGVLVTAKQVGVYAFGLDPAWHGADNALVFTNSYKMKMSVIFGVIQMTFGVILTTFNYKHFKHNYGIYLEFIPQLLFMLCIFGYLSFTIIYKWSIDWFATDANGNALYNSPPSLLNMLINMFLSPGYIKPGEELFRGQGPLQFILLGIALLSVPVMLLGKPFYLNHLHKQREGQGYSSLPSNGEQEHDAHDDGHDANFDFSDVMINQTIHTIEYCLNCISNTASYLRLWALSLAHAQLSSVLWDMTFSKLLPMKSDFWRPFALVFGFYMWFTLTVAILIFMEGLSAFLHALRLHWVEFNGKFYSGKGKKFAPFYFDTILAEGEN